MSEKSKKQTAVVYSSKYGTTKKYAEWIASDLKADLFDAKVKPEQLEGYNTVIFGGGVFAGSVSGKGIINKISPKNLVLFTVSIANPATADYTSLSRKNYGAKADGAKTFHFHGGIDYKKLSGIDRVIMFMMKKLTLDKKKPEDRSAYDKAMIDNYGKKVDFSYHTSIKPLVEYVKGLNNAK